MANNLSPHSGTSSTHAQSRGTHNIGAATPQETRAKTSPAKAESKPQGMDPDTPSGRADRKTQWDLPLAKRQRGPNRSTTPASKQISDEEGRRTPPDRRPTRPVDEERIAIIRIKRDENNENWLQQAIDALNRSEQKLEDYDETRVFVHQQHADLQVDYDLLCPYAEDIRKILKFEVLFTKAKIDALGVKEHVRYAIGFTMSEFPALQKFGLDREHIINVAPHTPFLIPTLRLGLKTEALHHTMQTVKAQNRTYAIVDSPPDFSNVVQYKGTPDCGWTIGEKRDQLAWLDEILVAHMPIPSQNRVLIYLKQQPNDEILAKLRAELKSEKVSIKMTQKEAKDRKDISNIAKQDLYEEAITGQKAEQRQRLMLTGIIKK